MAVNENNRDKFIRLAESRTVKSIKSLRLIGKLSDRSNYTYDEQDVKKIINILRAEITVLQQKFENSKTDQEITFKL